MYQLILFLIGFFILAISPAQKIVDLIIKTMPLFSIVYSSEKILTNIRNKKLAGNFTGKSSNFSTNKKTDFPVIAKPLPFKL